jgi:hypothetical protein
MYDASNFNWHPEYQLLKFPYLERENRDDEKRCFLNLFDLLIVNTRQMDKQS